MTALCCSAAPAVLGLVAQLGAETREDLVVHTLAVAPGTSINSAIWEYKIDGTPLSVLVSRLAGNVDNVELISMRDYLWGHLYLRLGQYLV